MVQATILSSAEGISSHENAPGVFVPGLVYELNYSDNNDSAVEYFTVHNRFGCLTTNMGILSVSVKKLGGIDNILFQQSIVPINTGSDPIIAQFDGRVIGDGPVGFTTNFIPGMKYGFLCDNGKIFRGQLRLQYFV